MQDDYVAVYTPEMSVAPERCCLVAVDLQYATGSREHGLGALLAREGRAADADYRFDRIERLVVPNTVRLLTAFRERGMRRVFLTYGSEVEDYSDLSAQMRSLCQATRNRVGEPEHELLSVLERQPTERVFNKLTPSAFTSTPIELVLHTYGVRALIFTGVSTNMCVEHTLRDAADRGFGCVLVEDACAADSEAMHISALTNVQRLYASVSSTEHVMDSLKLTRAVA